MRAAAAVSTIYTGALALCWFFVDHATLKRRRLPPPIDDIAAILDDRGRTILDAVLSCAVVGSPETVRRGVNAFIARHKPDELMVTAQIFDHAARLRSFNILSKT